MAFDNLIVSTEGAVTVVTINRPKKLNALDGATMHELKDFFKGAKKDAAIQAIVLTGAGEKAFVAGADITEINTLSPTDAVSFALRGQRIFGKIDQMGKPVIAAVNGFALGGGCELAMACHVRLASENAKFGQPEVKLGIIPGYGGTQRLARLVGKGRALELLLSGDTIGADEAYRIGLVNHVYPLAELVPKAVELAAKMLANGPLAVKYCIDAVNRGLNMPLAEALAYEAHLFGLSCATEDMHEGTAAFIEKRKPEWKRR